VAVLSDEQILGLNIAMRDAFAVRRRETRRYLPRVVDGSCDRKLALPQPLAQRFAFEQLGNQIRRLIL
jgi:hypothetical protein